MPAERVCEARIRNEAFDVAGKPMAPATETVEPRTLRMTKVSDGYAYDLTQGAGDTLMRLKAHTDARGRVLSAEVSGPGYDKVVAAALAPIDRNRFAQAMALSIPERMVVSRSFVPGTRYYADGAEDEISRAMSVGMGMPDGYTITLKSRLAFADVTIAGGRTQLNWSGPVTFIGKGVLNGMQMTMEGQNDQRVAHDTRTGLIVRGETKGGFKVAVDGQVINVIRSTETMTCRIVER